MQDFIKINKDDNVAVALRPIKKGTSLEVAGVSVTTIDDIPQGHKFAIKQVKKGEDVIKYGFRIGIAQADVEVGGWIHTHNLKTGLGELLDYEYHPEGHSDVEPSEEAFFDGYMRKNGKVGIRNEVWIIPTVGCVNSIARAIEASAKAVKPEGVDEVVAFNHPYGCSQTTEDQRIQEYYSLILSITQMLVQFLYLALDVRIAASQFLRTISVSMILTELSSFRFRT